VKWAVFLAVTVLLFPHFVGVAKAQKPLPVPPKPAGFFGLESQDWAALGTWATFVLLGLGLLLAFHQLRALKDARRADLILRLDERYCSQHFQELRQKAEKLRDKRPNDLTHEESLDLINFLGFFELLGFYVRNGFVTLDEVDMMFGSVIIQYRAYFAAFVDRGDSWKHLKCLYARIERARNARN